MFGNTSGKISPSEELHSDCRTKKLVDENERKSRMKLVKGKVKENFVDFRGAKRKIRGMTQRVNGEEKGAAVVM